MSYQLFITVMITTVMLGIINTLASILGPLILKRPVERGTVVDYAFWLGVVGTVFIAFSGDKPLFDYDFVKGDVKMALIIAAVCVVVSSIASIFYRVIYKTNFK